MFYYPPHTDGNYYTPYAWIDGCVRGGYSYNSWWTLTQPRTVIESPLQITLNGEYDPSDSTGNLHITIYAEDPIAFEDLKLRVALTEDSIYYNAPNGTLWHNYTLRDMIPNANGESIMINQGQTLEFDRAFDCTSPLDPHFCRLVVWVQADGTAREILQGAAVMVEDLETTSIDEPVELPHDFNLSQNYPNPFNAGTIINYVLERDSRVEISVYDILGQEIVTLIDEEKSAGQHQATWSGIDSDGKSVASGVYFYKLTADGVSESKQMMLVK